METIPRPAQQESAWQQNIWQRRWAALEQSVEALRRQIEQGEPAVQPYNALFAGLLSRFHDFATSQFHFFLNGFGNDPQHQLLEHSTLYPPQHVLHVTLDQVAYDLTLIQRAWQQRVLGTEDERATLKLADMWGQSLLASVSAGDNPPLIPPTAVLTYFQKATTIRLIPYANVALVGIPATATSVRRDLLALGHELGHYVYWHGFWRGERLPLALAHLVCDEPAWVEHWMEELFADVFGCLVWNHPAATLSAIEMMEDNLPADFVRDDGHYPVSALRPTLYVDALRHAAGDQHMLAAKAGVIEDEWEYICRLRGNATHFLPVVPPRHASAGEQVALRAARETLKRVTEALIDEMLPALRDSCRDVDAKEVLLAEGQAQEARRQLFADWFTDFEHYVATKAADELQFPPLQTRERWFDIIRQQAQQPQALKMPAEVWLNVFAADGWTIGGPETRPTGS